jgi:hypothetical protein
MALQEIDEPHEVHVTPKLMICAVRKADPDSSAWPYRAIS